MKKEITLGFFVLLGIICTTYLTVKLGRMDFLNTSNYTIHARFNSVSGLKSGADIEIAGVKIGTVGTISLNQDTNKAMIDLHLKKDILLPEDTIASIKTSGIIGDKYVALSLGGSDTYLQPNATIIDTESPTDLEALIGKYVLGGV